MAIDGDLDAARNVVKMGLLLYLGGMGSKKTNFYVDLTHRFGFGEAADEVQSLYLDGKREEAFAAIPDELVDATAMIGTEDEVAERVKAFERAGRRPADRLAGAGHARGAPAHGRAHGLARRGGRSRVAHPGSAPAAPRRIAFRRPMRIGVPKETAERERRVALVPDVVKALTAKELEVVVEPGAGEAAAYPDSAFSEAGAKLGDAWGADVVLRVAPPDRRRRSAG